MFQSFKDFFSLHLAPEGEFGQAPNERALRVASAALLLVTMRVDQVSTPAEEQAVLELLQRHFAMTDAETRALIELAESQASDASGDYVFTSVLNKGLDASQKLALVEMMWEIVYMDGRLDAHENHLMRKVADLLYIPQGDYVAAKARGRAAAAARH